MTEQSISIGGYFELELAQRVEYHTKAIRVNSARNALVLAMSLLGYRKIYIPYYTCNVLLESILRSGFQYEFYHVDRNFMPITGPNFDTNTAILYTNYFGICNSQVQACVNMYQNIIIDNSQAFFSYPLNGVPTFNSPRKFFGVPDGSYLFPGRASLELTALKRTQSYNRSSHLLKRIDCSPEEGYLDFKHSEKLLSEDGIYGMSRLSQRILSSIDYNIVIKRRQENYNTLHEAFGSINELTMTPMDTSSSSIPLVYPLLIKNQGVREELVSSKLYIPVYWDNVIEWTSHGCWERYLTNNLLALPIDQRYNAYHMEIVINKVSDAIGYTANVR